MIIELSAQLWKMERDYEDEVTLIFKIPAIQRLEADKIPVMEELKLKVETAESPIMGHQTL